MQYNNLYPVSYRQEEDWKVNNLYGPEILFEKLKLVEFNPQALEKACELLLKTHESLRTTFEFDGIKIYQQVNPVTNIKLYLYDLTGAVFKEMEFAKDQQSLMSDLSKGPLFKMFVRRLKNNVAWVYFITHHIISDDYSVNILITEFTNLYQKLNQNHEAEIEELPCQLKEYCVLAAGKYEAKKDLEVNYWKKKLDVGLLKNIQNRLLSSPAYSLKFKRSDNPDLDIIKALEDGVSASTCEKELPASVASLTFDLANKYKVSVSNILITALCLAIYKQYKMDDILISSLVNDRFHKNSRRLIANLTAGVFLRFNPKKEDLVKNVVTNVYMESLHSFKYMIFNYEPYRDLPLRSASMLHFNYIDQSLNGQPGNNKKKPPVHNEHIGADYSFYPLSLKVVKNQFGLNFFFLYNMNFYNVAEIDNFFEAVSYIISAIDLNPNAMVKDILIN